MQNSRAVRAPRPVGAGDGRTGAFSSKLFTQVREIQMNSDGSTSAFTYKSALINPSKEGGKKSFTKGSKYLCVMKRPSNGGVKVSLVCEWRCCDPGVLTEISLCVSYKVKLMFRWVYFFSFFLGHLIESLNFQSALFSFAYNLWTGGAFP